MKKDTARLRDYATLCKRFYAEQYVEGALE